MPALPDWDPALYLRFEAERTRPARDLAARLEGVSPRRVLDLGCGPGNSTAALAERFPNAEAVGADCSPAMLERARKICPGARFVPCDAGREADLAALGRFDVVFSNAFLQWMPRESQAALLCRFAGLLNPGGVMAMQVPQFTHMPASRALRDAAFSPETAAYFSGFGHPMDALTETECYDALGFSPEVSLWVTEYVHVMPDAEHILAMLRSTALRPYEERLPEALRGGFARRALENLRRAYPPRADGRVLFPFRRLFFTARIGTAI